MDPKLKDHDPLFPENFSRVACYTSTGAFVGHEYVRSDERFKARPEATGDGSTEWLLLKNTAPDEPFEHWKQLCSFDTAPEIIDVLETLD